MAKHAARLAGREKIADATYAFRLDMGEKPFEFKPGQTVDLIQPEPRYTDEVGNRRTLSIADAPGREHLLVATQLDPTHVASHLGLGRALVSLGRKDEAKPVLQAGIDAALSGRSNGGVDLVPEMQALLRTLG